MEIKLPQMSWFHQIADNRPARNIFTGSLGTDPEHGSIRYTTFNYKVYAMDEQVEGAEEEIIIIKAECHTQLPFSQGCKCVDYKEAKFDFSSEGINQAAQWLLEQASLVADLKIGE
ncbi:MAG: hypothetical protein E7563_06835 [Ruminococcaceae bacterium]|nr:hypothetical protein [Oscillospiraceae bacterium]